MATPLTKPSGLTTNNYKEARVIALNEHIAKDVTPFIEGTIVNCFISHCPYEIEIGKTYNVELTLNISDNDELERVAPTDSLIEKIDTGYSYFLYGELCNDKFLTFTSLSDEGIHHDHPSCNEHFVKLKVERIDASFH